MMVCRLASAHQGAIYFTGPEHVVESYHIDGDAYGSERGRGGTHGEQLAFIVGRRVRGRRRPGARNVPGPNARRRITYGRRAPALFPTRLQR